jgi:hypothetical protein
VNEASSVNITLLKMHCQLLIVVVPSDKTVHDEEIRLHEVLDASLSGMGEISHDEIFVKCFFG